MDELVRPSTKEAPSRQESRPPSTRGDRPVDPEPAKVEQKSVLELLARGKSGGRRERAASGGAAPVEREPQSDSRAAAVEGGAEDVAAPSPSPPAETTAHRGPASHSTEREPDPPEPPDPVTSSLDAGIDSVDELVPEWIGEEATEERPGKVGRFFRGIFGDGSTAPAAPDGDPDRSPQPRGRSAARPVDARSRIRQMIRSRDRDLVAAERDPERLYELASGIDSFVEQILETARQGR